MGSEIRNLNGFEAFFLTVSDLYIHLLMALICAALLGTLAYLSLKVTQPVSEQQPAPGRKVWGGLVIYALAFCTFGVVTAYFLTLGLNRNNPGDLNTLASTFATPFIALLTAGVAFVAAKSRTELAANELVLGVVSFLLAAMFSYQTFANQIHEVKAQDVGDQETDKLEPGEDEEEIPAPICNPERDDCEEVAPATQ